uniref:BPTI/Kunitz inhibitor domain-containing protein n=1 Tax=Callorhinchus milii TaxID=7868 RepID=A0A4W3I7C0_CALMI
RPMLTISNFIQTSSIRCLKYLFLADICQQPMETGPCRGMFLQWWYNSKTRKCTQFVFGGCRGNQNKFETKKECEATCAR